MPADLNDYFNKKSTGQDKQPLNFKAPNFDFMKNFGKFTPLVYVIIALVLVLVLAKPFAIVNSGEMGIKVTTGAFEKRLWSRACTFLCRFFKKS